MATIQWRPEVNALTTPQSYRILFVPRNVASREDIAADIARRHPNFSEADILTILNAEDEAVQARLLNGEQVTKSGAFSYSLTFTGRLNSPDEPLPPLDDCLQVNVRVSPPFVAAIRQNAKAERLPMEKKLPLIMAAADTLLKLNDVLMPQGVLQLTGDDLLFDPEGGSGGCVIEGTQSGKAAQTRFPMITNTAVMLMPTIPAQAHPWNNEYTIAVTTRYTPHGTPRTGIYERLLRTPLTLSNFGHPNPPDVGILTGSAATAYVTATGGSLNADSRLRIQVIQDIQGERLLFSLLDMKEGGAAGSEMVVTQNGQYTLPGFSGSALSSLAITVNNYIGLWDMIRNSYGGRLVDVLEVKMN